MPTPDANTTPPPPGANRRIWLSIRIGASLIAGAWFAWFAHARWTTPPAGQIVPGLVQRPRDLPPELDRLLKAIPTSPPATMPASMPAGGSFSPGDASFIVVGKWDTIGRSELADLAGHVSSAAVQTPLDELATWLRGHTPEELARLERPDSDPNTAFVFRIPNPQTEALAALLFRARQAAVERQDYAAAWGELRAVLRLQTAVRGSPTAYWMSESIVVFELGCLAQEADLPPELVGEMIATLRDELGLSMEAAAHQLPELHAQAIPNPDELLDAFYTDDGHGDGWLVLTALARTIPSQSGKPSAPRSGAWNLLSPLYHGRAQMRRRLDDCFAQVRAWEDVDYATAAARIERWRQSADAPNVFDAALMWMMPWAEASVKSTYDAVVMRRAVVVMLALSAHKQRAGAYPQSLDELVPSLLDAVPKDPFTVQPFEYRRERDTYCLKRSTPNDPNTPMIYYGSMLSDPRYPLREGTYQPMRDRNP